MCTKYGSTFIELLILWIYTGEILVLAESSNQYAFKSPVTATSADVFYLAAIINQIR